MCYNDKKSRKKVTIMDPRLTLCIDNCFAYKRWVKPLDWMLLIRDMGLTHVEQSADTECDPLYMGADYMRQWTEWVRRDSEKTGVRVVNVYSGHGTYTTCGMTHWHDGVRRRFLDEWMKAQVDTAARIGAGFGFFAHGIQHSDLQTPEAYGARLETLYDDLAELAAYAAEKRLPGICIEQMYTPHMPPWTIRGTEALMREVFARRGARMDVTIDLGHMNGQQFFQRPAREALLECLRTGARAPWLGTEAAHRLYREAAAGGIDADRAADAILADVDANPHLFAGPEDCSIWNWVESLGQYANIVHLQQTDGKSSPHWPFTDTYNRIGVASGEKLISSLAAAFARPAIEGLPEPVTDIALTLEPFVGTLANPYAAVDDIAQSVAYWRGFVPRDGMRLSEAAALLAKDGNTVI